ncbi:hypothetical protein TWF281_011089 [Arthrobotrys megalospora]
MRYLFAVLFTAITLAVGLPVGQPTASIAPVDETAKSATVAVSAEKPIDGKPGPSPKKRCSCPGPLCADWPWVCIDEGVVGPPIDKDEPVETPNS